MPAWAQNQIQNGDFESDQPLQWTGATLERGIIHGGRAALRLQEAADKPDVTARYSAPIELSQTRPEMIMASVWMRLEATRRTGPIRGGMTFHVEMADGASLAWYGSFAIDPSEMGSWVYREHRWKPPAPIKRIRPAVYLRGCEGALLVDDIYLGPAIEKPPHRRTEVPLAVTGDNGRFDQWAQVAFDDPRPSAHVFHLGATNVSNLEFMCPVDVKRTAPVSLGSDWGSQYWTLYSPPRRELAQIYTNERIDLSRAGPEMVRIKMSGLAGGGSHLAASGYVLITDCPKNFLIHNNEVTSKARWDTIKINCLSQCLGSSGVTAPFSLADLRSYQFDVTASRTVDRLRVRPTLIDARGSAVPLYDLEGARAEAGGNRISLSAETGDDHVPTGDYVGRLPDRFTGPLKFFAKVRLATSGGIREDVIEKTVEASAVPGSSDKTPTSLNLLGWSYPNYELSTRPGYCTKSVGEEVTDAKAAGITRLLIHARTNKETLYRSEIASASALGEADIIEIAVSEGKRQGVAIYAAYVLGMAQPDDLRAHPDWAMIGRDGKAQDWYCYNNPEVRAYHASLMAEIVTRYDVGGIALDFVRPNSGCHCPRCAELFEARFHKGLKGIDDYDADWRGWQRDSITDYVRELRAALRKARPGAALGGYAWARLTPDKDRGGQDWPRWLREDLMDFVAVGQYTASTPLFRAECHALRVIADRELGGRTDRLCPLLGVAYIHEANPSHEAAAAVIRRHLEAAGLEGFENAGFFSFSEIRPHAAMVRGIANPN